MRTRHHHQSPGFTLIELMVVLTIIAVLAGIAWPSYDRYATRARRTEGHALLMRLADAEAHHYAMYNRYTDDATTLGFTTPATSLHGLYTAQIAIDASGQSFTLTATPQQQQYDDACGSLTLDDTGQQTFSGTTDNGPCW